MKVDQEYTNDMLGRALSKVEHYSSKYGKQNIDNKKFNHFSMYINYDFSFFFLYKLVIFCGIINYFKYSQIEVLFLILLF